MISSTPSLKPLLLAFALGASIFFVLNDSFITHISPNYEQILDNDEPIRRRSAENSTNPKPISSARKQCLLPQLDPWHPTIRKYFNPDRNPMANCNRTFYPRSFVDSEGTLRIFPPNGTNEEEEDDEECFYRCLFPVDDWRLKFGDWTQVPTNTSVKPPCDVFDVKCELGQNSTYKFIHIQIHEQNRTEDVDPIPGTPDVHIVLLDSVSMSQFSRSMPMTIHYLRTQMDAIFFPYLNKVGLNSRPNAYGFLLGERAEAMPPNPWGKENPHGRSNELCEKSLDDENFIGFDFRSNGFRTMLNEDWGYGVFNWPSCRGFARPPVDHFLKPWALRYDGRKQFWEPELGPLMFKKSCLESHDYILSTLAGLTKKYPKRPKFSLSWMSNLAHDDPNGLYRVDRQFRDFFANTSKLADSFLIFMGDHGSRTGSVRQTIVGEMEDNNPFFVMSVPQKLRTNGDLMFQLQRNSKQIITHYDFYATLLELATKSGTWTPDLKTFSSTQFKHPKRKLLGSSLFHPLKGPRDCDSLQIPFTYCLCQHNYTLIDDATIALEIAKLAVVEMNKIVSKSQYHDKCAPLIVDKEKTSAMELQEFDRDGERRIFRANLRVMPSGGLYDAYAEMKNGKISLISRRFPRHDAYAKQTKCIPENFVRNYCFCKDLLRVTKIR